MRRRVIFKQERKFTFRALLVVSLLCINVLASNAQEIKTLVIFREHKVDFGRLREGKSFRTRISFKNISQEKVSVGCVNASGAKNTILSCDIAPDKLGPGDSGIVTIMLNSTAPAGNLKDSFLFEIKQGGVVIQEEKIQVHARILPAAGQKNGPVVLFENTVCDLDKIESNTQYNCTFDFRNTGDEPLLLTIRSESDSLKLDYPKGPVGPGQRAQIKASFIAIGQGGIRKYISVATNMHENKGNIYLVIKGKFSK